MIEIIESKFQGCDVVAVIKRNPRKDKLLSVRAGRYGPHEFRCARYHSPVPVVDLVSSSLGLVEIRLLNEYEPLYPDQKA